MTSVGMLRRTHKKAQRLRIVTDALAGPVRRVRQQALSAWRGLAALEVSGLAPLVKFSAFKLYYLFAALRGQISKRVIGQTIEHYRVTEKIGAGGMSNSSPRRVKTMCFGQVMPKGNGFGTACLPAVRQIKNQPRAR